MKNNKMILECIVLFIIIILLIIGTVMLEKNNNDVNTYQYTTNDRVKLLTNALNGNNLNILKDKITYDKYNNAYYEIEDLDWNQNE